MLQTPKKSNPKTQQTIRQQVLQNKQLPQTTQLLFLGKLDQQEKIQIFYEMFEIKQGQITVTEQLLNKYCHIRYIALSIFCMNVVNYNLCIGKNVNMYKLLLGYNWSNLQYLKLQYSNITLAKIKTITKCNMPNLQNMQIWQNYYGSEFFRALCKGKWNLNFLNLDDKKFSLDNSEIFYKADWKNLSIFSLQNYSKRRIIHTMDEISLINLACLKAKQLFLRTQPKNLKIYNTIFQNLQNKLNNSE